MKINFIEYIILSNFFLYMIWNVSYILVAFLSYHKFRIQSALCAVKKWCVCENKLNFFPAKPTKNRRNNMIFFWQVICFFASHRFESTCQPYQSHDHQKLELPKVPPAKRSLNEGNLCFCANCNQIIYGLLLEIFIFIFICIFGSLAFPIPFAAAATTTNILTEIMATVLLYNERSAIISLNESENENE